MRLNGSRVPYRFPTSNIAIKTAKLNMSTKADTDIFAEVFYVQIKPGAGFTARGVVFKPPQAHLSSQFSLNSVAGRNRGVIGDWQSSIKNIFDPIRQRYSSGTIDASFDSNINPVLIVTSEGAWNAGGEANIKGNLGITLTISADGQMTVHSSPILYSLASLDVTGEPIFDGIRNRVFSPTLSPTAQNNTRAVRNRTGNLSASTQTNLVPLVYVRVRDWASFEGSGKMDSTAYANRLGYLDLSGNGEVDIHNIRLKPSSAQISPQIEQVISYLRTRGCKLSSDASFSQTTLSHALVRDWLSIDADGQLNPLSSPICFARLDLDSLANMNNNGIRQRVYAPSFNPTGEQNTAPLVIRRTSSQMDTTADYVASSKITKLYQADFDTIAQQAVDSRVLAHAMSQMESTVETPTVGSVIFAPYISIDTKAKWGIKSQILQLISQLEYQGDLEPGDLLTINVEDKTVKLNGENVRHNFEGDFIKMRKGLNKLEYWDEESDRDLEITIDYEPRWL